MKIFITAQNSEIYREEISPDFAQCPPNVKTDAGNPRQIVSGFGGAFTESAAYTLSRMSKENRKRVIDLYFDKENGIGYTLGRTHIASCDFSIEPYDYIEAGDAELKTFDMGREDKWVIPFIKDAGEAAGRPISLLASPWSPSAFMKDNNNRLYGGRLLPEYYETWAAYFVKYLQIMRSKGITIDYVSIQNDPDAKQTWDSCLYSGEQERDFVKVLGKALETAGIDIKILVHDHNRDILFSRTKIIYDDEEAAKYVYGAGVHWYVSEDFSQCGLLHDYRPDKGMIFTEGCQEGGVHLGDWKVAERYARNIMGDMNNWVEGYIEWNLALDETGGPNHVGNLCDAPIICDTTTDTVNINPSFWYISHFSKFIKPGAVILPSSADDIRLITLAAKNPCGENVLVILNQDADGSTVTVQDSTFRLPGRSIATVVYFT